MVFGPRAEVVQMVPAARAAPRSAPARMAVARPAPARVAAVRAAVAAPKPGRGNYYVQLGAYANAAVARDAWTRYARRVGGLAESKPQGAQVSTQAGNFYRLSVGGFARGDADALCRQVRSRGGNCFVRTQAGDTAADWTKRGSTEVASR